MKRAELLVSLLILTTFAFASVCAKPSKTGATFYEKIKVGQIPLLYREVADSLSSQAFSFIAFCSTPLGVQDVERQKLRFRLMIADALDFTRTFYHVVLGRDTSFHMQSFNS